MAYIRALREAIATWLEEDDDIVDAVLAVGGKVLSWQKGQHHAVALTKSDLPAIVLMPGSASPAAATNRQVDEEVVVSVMLAHESEDVGDVEDLVALTRESLYAGARAKFNLSGAESPWLVTLGTVSYVNLIDQDEETQIVRGWSWRAGFEITCKVRLTV